MADSDLREDNEKMRDALKLIAYNKTAQPRHVALSVLREIKNDYD